MGDALEPKVGRPRRPDTPTIPLLAMLSLVFSVLTIVLLSVAFVDVGAVGTAVLAVVCAHIARRQIACDPYSFKGTWATLPGLTVGYGMLAFFLFVLSLPEPGQRERNRRINCAANLKQIGLA